VGRSWAVCASPAPGEAQSGEAASHGPGEAKILSRRENLVQSAAD